jgi:nucleotide-binding universal stress UspA family protein
MSTLRDELVVAIDDDEGFAALDWAVARALDLGLGLRLVHVTESEHRLAGRDPTTRGDGVPDRADRLVHAAAEHVRTVSGDALGVATAVAEGRPADVLAEMGDGCTAVVVSHRRHDAAVSAFGGSVAADVATRTDVSVVSVPRAWKTPDPLHHRGLAPRVTVGVADAGGADPLVAHAIETCHGHECVVTLLHAWHVSAVHELGLHSQDVVVDGMEREATRLDDVAAAWRSTSPNVQIETRLMKGRPLGVMKRASHDSERLVIGRSHRHPAGHLGSVASALLHQAACPVELLPAGDTAMR